MKIVAFDDIYKIESKELREVHETLIDYRRGRDFIASDKYYPLKKYPYISFFMYHYVVIKQLEMLGFTENVSEFKDFTYATDAKRLSELSALDKLTIEDIVKHNLVITDPFIEENELLGGSFYKEVVLNRSFWNDGATTITLPRIEWAASNTTPWYIDTSNFRNSLRW